MVIAPERERSAVGHSITLHKPLRTTRVSVNGCGWGLAVNGTPADCIKLGLVEILDDRPDVVVSGINPGANVGVNLNYSGTVSAAKEATLYGIPAIAVSIMGDPRGRYREAAKFILRLAENVDGRGLPFGTFLNVNIPDRPVAAVAGVKVSKQGIRLFSEYFEKRVDPRNRVYYWQGCDSHQDSGDLEVDSSALCQNFITITPLKCDMTDYSLLEEIKGWHLDRLRRDIDIEAESEDLPDERTQD
jgi:5'-nucleotidase